MKQDSRKRQHSSSSETCDNRRRISIGKTGPAGRFRCGDCHRRFGFRHNLWRHVRTPVACDEHRRYRKKYNIPMESGDEYDEEIFPGTDPSEYMRGARLRLKSLPSPRLPPTQSDEPADKNSASNEDGEIIDNDDVKPLPRGQLELTDYDNVLLDHIRMAYIGAVNFPHFLAEIRPGIIAQEAPEQFDILLSQFTLMATILKAGILEFDIPHMGDIWLKVGEFGATSNEDCCDDPEPNVPTGNVTPTEVETTIAICSHCKQPIPFVDPAIVSACFSVDCTHLFHTNCAPENKVVLRHDGSIMHYCAECPRSGIGFGDTPEYAQL